MPLFRSPGILGCAKEPGDASMFDPCRKFLPAVCVFYASKKSSTDPCCLLDNFSRVRHIVPRPFDAPGEPPMHRRPASHTFGYVLSLLLCMAWNVQAADRSDCERSFKPETG